MSIRVEIYSNANAKSKTISVDLASGVLADSLGTVTGETDYYFKFTTGAKDTENASFPVKIATGLDSLALNRQVQSASNTSNNYSDINSMVVDYIHNYLNGNIVDKYNSGARAQNPIDFTR
tara:strand:+ start:76001 stop:76363 length:363 start_codon:yes stop_codon:yes gene_type:complete